MRTFPYHHNEYPNIKTPHLAFSPGWPGAVTPSSRGDVKVNTRPVDGAGWSDYFWHFNVACTATEPMSDRTRYACASVLPRRRAAASQGR